MKNGFRVRLQSKRVAELEFYGVIGGLGFFDEDSHVNVPEVLRALRDIGSVETLKVYYNSPQRPSDSGRLLTYYEDLSVAPQQYVSKPGDNIRVVAQNLLGHERSWMEVWATNPDVDSKNELAEAAARRPKLGRGHGYIARYVAVSRA